MGARYTIDNQPAKIDWAARGDERRIVQNAKNLLMAFMGEVPYDRHRGSDPTLLDRPLGMVQAAIGQELDTVLAWEPRVRLLEARATMDARGLTIEAEIEIVESDDDDE